MPTRRERNTGGRARAIIGRADCVPSPVSSSRLVAAVLLGLAVCCGPCAWARPCSADSAEQTTALVELYTAAPCAGCEQASTWLSSLARRPALGGVIPVSLPADDRASLGAEDGEARQRLSKRQQRLSLLQRMALVHSPQVLVQGQEFPYWRRPAVFDAEVQRIHSQRARARIAMQIHAVEAGRVAVAVQARLLDAGRHGDAALYFAPFDIRQGERAVLEWLGPVVANQDGRISMSRVLRLRSGAVHPAAGVVAFVQDRGTREVLQALLLPACSP